MLRRYQCFCGNADEFEDNAVPSDQCGLSITDLCTGDPTTACGGRDAIRVYKKLNYSLLDCFQDDKASRIMQLKGSAAVMSAEVRKEVPVRIARFASWSMRGYLLVACLILHLQPR